MKTSFKIILLAVFTAFALQSFAQKPEPVYSIVRQVHDFDWYAQQAKAWKHEIDMGTNNNMAWVYFYRANRMANFFSHSKWEKEKKDYLLPLNEIVKMAEKAIPNTFELYFLEAYDNGCYTEKGRTNLMKAQKLRPYDKIMLSDLMNYYQLFQDTANINIVSEKWFESNETPAGILNFNYNVLMSLDKNAVILVNGDNATYPLWILQHAKQIRKDVLVLNVSLLAIENYREKVFKENSIPPLDSSTAKHYTMSKLIKHIIDSVKNRPIYVSTLMNQDLYKDFKNNMYMIGLAFKYSEKPFDNLAVLQNNVENRFLLDYLKVSFNYNDSQSVVNQMNLSYLAVFLKLYEHYELSGATEKAKKIRELASTIAKNAGNTDWMKYFGN